jgi:glucose/arabinose dehydrogenase
MPGRRGPRRASGETEPSPRTEDQVSLRPLLRTVLLPAVALALLLIAHPAVAHDPPSPSDGEPRLDQPDGHVHDVGIQAIVPGDPVEPGFSEEVVFSGIPTPTVVEFAADGRVFVALKDGRIFRYDSLTDSTPTTYADLRANVHSYWDRGLLGMALDPNFTTNGRLYVAYTYNAPPGQSAPVWLDHTCPNPPDGPGGTTDGCVVTSRLSALTNGANEQILVHDWCQQFPSHSMSDIVFDTEGALIVNGGDGASFSLTDFGQEGGSAGSPTPINPCGDPHTGGTPTIPGAEGGALRAQDLRTTDDPLGLSGSVIRVDRMTGLAMSDNPGTGGTSTNSKRMIAHGFRNPFRMAIHPVAGELWIGDVGWNTWEEINRHGDPEAAVKNYGWPCFEGTTFEPSGYHELDLCSSLSSFAAPYFAYPQAGPVVSGDGCGGIGSGSISGMAFYGGGGYPAEYDNALFFTDYSRDCMWVLPAGTGNGLNVGARALFATVEDPVHLTVGPDGDLFYVDIGDVGTANDGTVRRIRYTDDNEAPSAQLSATPTSGGAPLAVSFDAGDSTDPDNDPLTYAWDFDEDGTGQFDDATGPTPSNTYDTIGTYVARVRVSDPDGASDIATATINAGNEPPTASITQPAATLEWSVGDDVAFAGSATDSNGPVPVANYTWQLVIAHCGPTCHEHVIGTWSGVASGTLEAPDHEYPSHLLLRLHVEDGLGGEDDTVVELHPETVAVTVRSSPAGVQLTSGWVTDTTPFTMTAIRGSRIGLIAPSGATIGGIPYTWVSWSDGGARSHTITATTSRTLTATFSGGFTDVPPDHPFHADIGWLVGQDITSGCATDPPRYCPSNPVTRAQMASFLVRALDLPPSTTDRFGDDEGSIHENDINALAAAGVTGGCGPGRYCPNASVTRAEMASFLVRAFGLPSSAADQFTDDETSIHEADINALAAADITGGCAANRYCPASAVTRAQMAAFLRRALD